METKIIYNGSELYHYGILGQKWGIRRYQNFDGSYTKAGIQRYYKSKDTYEKRKQNYNELKKDSNVSRYDKNYAKAKVKEAKRQMNKDYKHLALDKKADKGKILYASGKRITNNTAVTNYLAALGGGISVGSLYLKKAGVLNKKQSDIMLYSGLGFYRLYLKLKVY